MTPQRISAGLPARAPGPAMIPIATAIFVGAFLLFQVQPILAKYILPWYGGTPAVWTTCLVFFQTFLLFGYLYAHLLSRVRPVRRQVIIHLAFAAAALFFLPITPSGVWKPLGSDQPFLRIVLMLTACVGVPYTILASTGPLLQRWLGMIHHQLSPYRLFALSNAGSLLGLVTYPLIVEPYLTRNSQSVLWGWGMVLFAVSMMFCGFTLWRKNPSIPKDPPLGHSASFMVRLLWVALPAVASMFLLGTTNRICQEVAVVPFLWVAPLVLYLASFIVCFDNPRWYSRPLMVGVALVSVGMIAAMPFLRQEPPLGWSLAVYGLALFSGCMLLHGELARMKPGQNDLTAYYLHIAAGGAIGGLSVALLAPQIFSDYAEYPLTMLLGCLLISVVFFRDPQSVLRRSRRTIVWSCLMLIFAGLSIAFRLSWVAGHEHTIRRERNFYGTLAVGEYEAGNAGLGHRTLRHGNVLHGLQYLAPDLQSLATSYYTMHGGMGLGILEFPRQENRRIGVVGLGAGTLAAWARSSDYIRFYEINPLVIDIARTDFTYLRNCRARIDVIPGDARLSMEAETRQSFDILVLDAFNSDAPPVHLLTKEAFELYIRHLRPDGLIAVNVTSWHLDFFPVIARAAAAVGWSTAYLPDSNPGNEFYRSSSTWMLLTNNPTLLASETIRKASVIPTDRYGEFPLWTDDYNSLLTIITW